MTGVLGINEDWPFYISIILGLGTDLAAMNHFYLPSSH